MTTMDGAQGGAQGGVRYGGQLEVKEDGWGLEGLASTWTEDLQGDVVEYGAFAESLAQRPRPPLLWSHDHTKVIGVAQVLKETPEGLWGRWRISKTREGADVRQLLLDRAVDGLSIGFRVPGPGDYEHRGGVRRLRRLSLHEVSVCALPANERARVSLVKAMGSGAPPSYLAAFLARQEGRRCARQQRGQAWLEDQRMRAQLLRLRIPVLTAAGGR